MRLSAASGLLGPPEVRRPCRLSTTGLAAGQDERPLHPVSSGWNATPTGTGWSHPRDRGGTHGRSLPRGFLPPGLPRVGMVRMDGPGGRRSRTCSTRGFRIPTGTGVSRWPTRSRPSGRSSTRRRSVESAASETLGGLCLCYRELGSGSRGNRERHSRHSAGKGDAGVAANRPPPACSQTGLAGGSRPRQARTRRCGPCGSPATVPSRAGCRASSGRTGRMSSIAHHRSKHAQDPGGPPP